MQHKAHGSYWPIVLAATLTMATVGLITHLALSVVGLVLTLVAVIAWGLERFQGPERGSGVGDKAAYFMDLGEEERAVETPEEGVARTGTWGMIWFIATEAVFFGNMIAAYLYLRVTRPEWPPPGTPHLELGFPIINTVILLGSTLPNYYAQRSIRRDDQRGLQIGLVLSALLGAIFLAGQAYEYASIGITPQTNIFAAGFFTLTGFHGAHVAVGIGLLLTMFVLSRRGRFSSRHHFPVEFASTYWHFVDVVWIFLFTILYLIQ